MIIIKIYNLYNIKYIYLKININENNNFYTFGHNFTCKFKK